MIDLHTHILPGIDDGAQDFYDTLEMARMAVDSGITAMAVTPHCNIPRTYRNYFDEEYEHLFQKTEELLLKEGIPLKLYKGMEVFVTPDLPKLLKEGKIIPFHGGQYLLVEFAFQEDPDFVEYMLEKIQDMGLHPIVAHPERYEFVKRDIQCIYEWKQKGYSIQVNKGSFQGRFGRKAEYVAHKLLQHNLITVIASDAHSPYRRTPYMQNVYDELAFSYEDDYLKILFEENPKRILLNKPLIRLKEHSFLEEMW